MSEPTETEAAEAAVPSPPVIEPQHLRIAEALLFAAAEPLDAETIGKRLPEGIAAEAVLQALAARYAGAGVVLREAGGRWAFYTAPDLSWLLEEHRKVQRRLSRAAMETLAIVAYHQPITRAEIEELRGVALSKGTLDALLEAGWVRMRGRRKTPGRPVTYGTTDDFLTHFGLAGLDDLPGVDELRAAGLLEPMPEGASDGLPQPGQPLPDREEEPLDEAAEAAEQFRPADDPDLPGPEEDGRAA